VYNECALDVFLAVVLYLQMKHSEASSPYRDCRSKMVELQPGSHSFGCHDNGLDLAELLL
jgi:hypothetical protein